MKNITLALDEATVEAGRHAIVAEMFRLMDGYPGHSGGERWTRDELYAR